MYLYEVATESVCESAARLLFMSIKWAKSVPAFSTLSLQDQVWPRGHWALGGRRLGKKQYYSTYETRGYLDKSPRPGHPFLTAMRKWFFLASCYGFKIFNYRILIKKCNYIMSAKLDMIYKNKYTKRSLSFFYFSWNVKFNQTFLKI